jgi:hypothetical protein
MSNILTKEFKNPRILNPLDNVVYVDSLKPLNEDYVYETPVMNAKAWSLAASSKPDDPLKITEAFYNNGTEETNFADQANTIYSQLNKAKETGDKSLAAAIITSKEFTALQDNLILGSNDELIRQGILTQIFEEIPAPLLTGRWLAWSNDVQYQLNLPESKSPEPTMGTASTTSIEVPKHGGAVAITDRARQVITDGGNVFNRLVGQLQQKKARSESIIVRDAIEAIASTNNQTGVDFGARSGTPPASTQNAIDFLNTLITFFDSTAGEFNTIVSKSFIFNEFILNDTIRGGNTLNPLNPITSVQEQVSSVGVLPGVQWYRDNLMTSSTNMYVMDRNRAGKSFRGPTRAYTVTDPDTETEKYVTKSHFVTYIVDSTLIARATGVAA